MLLYDAAVSGNCWKVRQLFAHLGIDYETKTLDVVDRSDRQSALGALNPALRIPVVIEDDGTVHNESDGILLHFAEGTPYLPSDPVARREVLRWLLWEQANLQAYVAMPWFLTVMLPADPDPTVMGYLHFMGKIALKALETHLATVDGGYIVADQYTIADIALYPYVARAEMAGFDLDRYGAIQAWLARVQAQPGFTTPPTQPVPA